MVLGREGFPSSFSLIVFISEINNVGYMSQILQILEFRDFNAYFENLRTYIWMHFFFYFRLFLTVFISKINNIRTMYMSPIHLQILDSRDVKKKFECIFLKISAPIYGCNFSSTYL